MGNQHIDPLFAKILDTISEPRNVRQVSIEQQIDNHRPDFQEAVEILHALENALRSRYDHALLDDARHYFDYLTKALERAEADYMRPTDPE